jgi:hypothetical protein
LDRVLLKHKGYVTLPELSFLLRVTLQTVHNWSGRGEREFKLQGFPQMQIRGKRWVFQVGDVEGCFEVKIADRDRQFAQPLLSHRDIMHITGYGDTTVRTWMREAKAKRIGKVLLRIERKRLEEFLVDRYGWNLLEEYPKVPVIGV